MDQGRRCDWAPACVATKDCSLHLSWTRIIPEIKDGIRGRENGGLMARPEIHWGILDRQWDSSMVDHWSLGKIWDGETSVLESDKSDKRLWTRLYIPCGFCKRWKASSRTVEGGGSKDKPIQWWAKGKNPGFELKVNHQERFGDGESRDQKGSTSSFHCQSHCWKNENGSDFECKRWCLQKKIGS